MFPFCDSPRRMDMPLYQQLLLSPPSPKPDQSSSSSFYYYPCSPPFAAAAGSFQLGGGAVAATPVPAVIDSPELSSKHPSMEEPPAPPKLHPGNAAQGLLDAASRKDRHSKIRTARGMRDRRIRLSLDVAKPFFALQDMLGFDKPSKTVQWLLSAAKAAIRELRAADDSSSECVEDASSSLSVDVKHIPTTEDLGGQQEKGNNGGCSEGKKPAKPKTATTTPKAPRKSGNAHHPVLDKETRAKARERARERTKEKHRMRWVKLSSAIDVEVAGASSRDRRPGINTNLNPSYSMNVSAVAAELEERCSLTLNNGGRAMQQVSMASDPGDMTLGFGNGGYGGGGGNYCQEQWELGGVVFAHSHF